MSGANQKLQSLTRDGRAAIAGAEEEARALAEKIRIGAHIGPIEKQDGSKIPVETRNPFANEIETREWRGRQGQVGNIGGGPITQPGQVDAVPAASTSATPPLLAAPAVAQASVSRFNPDPDYNLALGAGHVAGAGTTAPATAEPQSPRERHEARIRAEVQASLAIEKARANLADAGRYNEGMKKGEGLTNVFETLEGTQRRILAQNKKEGWNPESTEYPGLTINQIAEMKIQMLKDEMNRPREAAIKASVAGINPEYLKPEYMAP